MKKIYILSILTLLTLAATIQVSASNLEKEEDSFETKEVTRIMANIYGDPSHVVVGKENFFEVKNPYPGFADPNWYIKWEVSDTENFSLGGTSPNGTLVFAQRAGVKAWLYATVICFNKPVELIKVQITSVSH